ncbi:hypothetical protein BDV97DRAFT_396774 [Delphinella strobiligena]|nr:hypothetical protein BDV97DRAFT_396774 [Delphinella strobiligena]
MTVFVERQTHKRPFSSWVRRLTNLNRTSHSSSKKAKKASKNNNNNNPYPESGYPAYHRPSTESSSRDFHTPPTGSRNADSRDSYSSISHSRNGDNHRDFHDHDHMYNSSRSAAPTVATQPGTIGTIHSDAGYSHALTGTTAGALSSIDGNGANSTFSSPNNSTHSLTTTLTTIQSTNALQPPANPNTNANNAATNTVNPVHFTHQYPVTASALPSHLQAPAQQQHQPTTYASATAHNLLTDNASILTLASSSKRRRRSIDTDASVRALAPHSVWGNSSESLPLSVLSGNMEHNPRDIRPSATGLLRDERASIYSNQGVSAPALASERNSYYAASHKATTAHKDRTADANADGRSVRSVHMPGSTADAKSLLNFDGASLRGYEGSIRSGALGHGRNESVSGSPLGSPSLLRRPSGAISLDVRDERADEGKKENSIRDGIEGIEERYES